MRVEIFYSYKKGGKTHHTAVTTEDTSVAAATSKFTKRFAGKFEKVIEAKEVKKPS